MADIPKRITELDETYTNPADGLYIPVEKSGDSSASKFPMTKYVPYYERAIDIGAWNMQTTQRKQITVPDAANVMYVSNVVIFDDNELEYPAWGIYDSWFHEQSLKNGYFSGSTVGNTSGSTAGTQENILWAGAIDTDGTVYKKYGSTNITVNNFAEGQYLITLESATSFYVPLVTPRRMPGKTTNSAFVQDLSTTEFTVIIQNESNYSESSAFEMQIADSSVIAHTHTIPTLSYSGYPYTNHLGRSINVMHQFDRTNSRIYLTHNCLGEIDINSSSFGVGGLQNVGQMALFTNAPVTRGYVFVKYKIL